MYLAVVFWHTVSCCARIIETRFHGSFDDCLSVVAQAPCFDPRWYIYKGDFVSSSVLVARSSLF